MDLIEACARVAHEANRAWCLANGDYSQPVWDDAPGWQKDSARSGVVFHLDNPDAGQAASHENWMRDKAADGWTYDPEKDPAKKEHPCMVPYEDLPAEQQIKDAIFIGVVRAVFE